MGPLWSQLQPSNRMETPRPQFCLLPNWGLLSPYPGSLLRYVKTFSLEPHYTGTPRPVWKWVFGIRLKGFLVVNYSLSGIHKRSTRTLLLQKLPIPRKEFHLFSLLFFYWKENWILDVHVITFDAWIYFTKWAIAIVKDIINYYSKWFIVFNLNPQIRSMKAQIAR